MTIPESHWRTLREIVEAIASTIESSGLRLISFTKIV